MRNKKIFVAGKPVLAILIVALFVTGAVAQTEKVLYTFVDGKGAAPYSGLIFDQAGNLYGTTGFGGVGTTCAGGGPPGCGTVFELEPTTGGRWTETVLHRFNNNGKDGFQPFSSLVLDTAGNLYGTTAYGGTHGYGAVYELSPKTGGGWTEKILHSFNNNGIDGTSPSHAGLVLDAAGNLYGTTNAGGASNYGIVFELSPRTTGGWTEKILHSFDDNGTDGYYPESPLTFDTAGNLYGTTLQGGTEASKAGTVFELTPKGKGVWTERVVHSFGGVGDGAGPYYATLIFDASGNLYGTTNGGGLYGGGTAYEMTESGGVWTETVLHSFNEDTDGDQPYGGLILVSGNLYGTLYESFTTAGVVFELTPGTGGTWTESQLWGFLGGSDGAFPYDSLISDSAGNLYGTTGAGGIHSDGIVFEVTP
jgi:uncharacterized repeat protein (TIGR03803 family)